MGHNDGIANIDLKKQKIPRFERDAIRYSLSTNKVVLYSSNLSVANGPIAVTATGQRLGDGDINIRRFVVIAGVRKSFDIGNHHTHVPIRLPILEL